MNERIKQLAQQSQLAELYDRYVEQCIKNADDDILDYDVIVKEFAELIIGECLRMCDCAEVAFLEHSYSRESDGATSVKIFIKEYFGVEE